MTSVLITGGGEPFTSPDVVASIKYASELGLFVVCYTNGINLGEHPELAVQTFDPFHQLVYIRVSLNFVTPAVGRRFSGAAPEDIEAQFNGLESLIKAREAQLPAFQSSGKRPPAIQVSTICDASNVTDLRLVCHRVAEVFREHSFYHDPGDDYVVRPLTVHDNGRYTLNQHDGRVVREIVAVCGKSGAGRAELEAAGLNVFLGFGLDRLDRGEGPDSYESILAAEYDSRDCCWANSVFLTAGPDRCNCYLCTDRNCYPAYGIGSLAEPSVNVAQLYRGRARRDLLSKVHASRCGPDQCEPTCRAVRLNRIARAIRSGELGEAEIEEIRQRSVGDRPVLIS